jgi:hypothetical protein
VEALEKLIRSGNSIQVRGRRLRNITVERSKPQLDLRCKYCLRVVEEVHLHFGSLPRHICQ